MELTLSKVKDKFKPQLFQQARGDISSPIIAVINNAAAEPKSIRNLSVSILLLKLHQSSKKLGFSKHFKASKAKRKEVNLNRNTVRPVKTSRL